jgi:hypothetical protein
MSVADPLFELILRRDLVAVGHPLVRHPVQGRAPHQQLPRLPGERARTGPLAEEHLEPEDRHLRQGSPVVVALALPLRPPVPPDSSQVLVAVVSLGLRVAVLPDARSLLGRDHRPRSLLSDGVVALPVVVAAVARHLPDLLLDLREQGGQRLPVAAGVRRDGRRRHLARRLVHAEMQLTPRPPLRPPVAPDLPLALAVDFHAGRVHHQVQRLGLAPPRERDRKRLPAPRERRVARHTQREAEQFKDRAEQAARGPQRQPVDLHQRRHRQDGRCRVGARRTALPGSLMLVPRLQHILSDPEGQTSATDESFVIVSPVTETVRLPLLVGHASRVAALLSP